MNSLQLKGKHVYVMGLGRFGGGVGVTRFLAQHGANITVGDTGGSESLAESIEQIQDLIDTQSVRMRLGEHIESDLEGIEILVVNPAVPSPWLSSFVNHAIDKGILVTTEIELVYQMLNPSKVIAVTGSAGKSTTCAMIHHALDALGYDVVLGGNIGGSLLNQLEQIRAGAFVVLELSSAMLYWLGKSGVLNTSPPAIACVTNCQPNHLDWHGSWEHYSRSKRVLVQSAGDNSVVILGEQVQEWGAGIGAKVKAIGPEGAINGCLVPGGHNGINAGFAFAAVDAMLNQQGIATLDSSIKDAVRTFPGLEHRLAMVHEAHGIRYFNDSKSTVPDATLLAVEAICDLVEPSRIHLVAGGYDKGIDLSSISQIANTLGGLYTIGDTGKGIVWSCDTGKGYAKCFGDLDRAMKAIHQRAVAGDVVVLSPGCASWDQFTNYQERGDRFTQLAKGIAQIQANSIDEAKA